MRNMRKKIILIILCLCVACAMGCGEQKNVPIEEETVVVESVTKYSEEEIETIAKKNCLVRSYDDFDDVSFYYANYMLRKSDEQKYYCEISNGMYLYMSQKDEDVDLRCVFTYEGDDWIFLDNVALKIDEEKYEYDIPYSDVKRKAFNDGTVSEKYDFSVSDSFIDVIKSIYDTGECSIRFKGEDGSNTVELNSSDILAIRHVVTAYEILRQGK